MRTKVRFKCTTSSKSVSFSLVSYSLVNCLTDIAHVSYMMLSSIISTYSQVPWTFFMMRLGSVFYIFILILRKGFGVSV